jgi:DNA-binding SARP family transcriptional activator
MAMEFRVLGAVEASVDGVRVDVGHARQRCVLAALLANANEVVSADVLIERVWGDGLPLRARENLRTYLSRLRVAVAGGADIRRQAGGYVLTVDTAAVDLHRFRALCAEARTAGDHARTLLEQALHLWHGEALAGLDSPWADLLRDELEAERVAAELAHNDLRLHAGEYADLVPVLTRQTALRPLDERLAGQLMLALFRSGRQADALTAYHAVRARLADELGTDPGRPLRKLHQRLLAGDPEPSRAEYPVPALLPAGVRAFTGRAEQLAQLDEVLASSAREPSAVVISAVSGTGGVGKTALAVHWAHRVAARFPDGQLYLNLRGFDPAGSPVTPKQAARSMLEALGVAPEDVPSSVDASVAMFRSLVAHKRVLVVLDNARDTEHVRSLLPGSPSCLVVVTSRNRLTGLVVAEGARTVMLDVLTEGEARELLGRRIGTDRARAEPDAVDEIVARCARLPLALAIVGARATAHADVPLAALARALRDAGAGLDAFAGAEPGTDLRAVLSWSYRTLRPAAQRLFRLLGPHSEAEFGAAAAASVAGDQVARVRALLAELTGVHMLVEPTPGRYAFHDLLRAYAIELAEKEDGVAERRAALHRLLDHYLHTAHNAALVLHPHRDEFALDPPGPDVTVTEFTDLELALSWFTTERPTLVAAIERARRDGAHGYAWKLAWAITEFFDRRGHLEQQAATYRIALDSVRHTGDRRGHAHVHRSLGRTYAQLARFTEAQTHFDAALALHVELGDRNGQAGIHHNMGWMAELDNRHEDSLHHDRLALELYEAGGDRVGQARALNAIGWSHSLLGDHERSLEVCRRALALNQELGDRPGESATWDSIGFAHHHLGQYEEALAGYQCSLDMLRELGDRGNEADVLIHIGDTRHAMDDLPAARTAWRLALDIMEELGHPDVKAVHAKLDTFG